MTINLLHQHLQKTIADGTVDPDMFSLTLSSLGHLQPFYAVTIRKLCFSLITNVLNSRYTAVEQYWMAGTAVELAWKDFKYRFCIMQPDCVLPLLGFLQLSETFYSTHHKSAPGAFALQMLSVTQEYDDFCPEILPILTSTLLPTHPLLSRRSALKAFIQFSPGIFSQTEGVSYEDRARLLQAVGNPFQPAPGIPLSHEEQAQDAHNSMMATVILIGFASSDLWCNHLHHSNFASWEEETFTVEYKMSVFTYSQDAVWLRMPAKIIATIERLEEIQCLNTAEAMLMWAWSFGVVDAVDHHGWRLIGHKTLAFYQTHGTNRLKTLSQHIMNSNKLPRFTTAHQEPQCQVEGVRLPVRIAERVRRLDSREGYYSDLPVADACLLKRLYQLFGCDPMTWKELVTPEGVNGGVDVSLGKSPNPIHSMDYMCDYT